MAFLLEIPYEDRKIASHFKCEWNTTRSVWVYPGDKLPSALRGYLPKKYSWTSYQMRKGTGNRLPVTDTGSIVLRPDQLDNVRTLKRAFDAGCPEVVIASETGTGKTYTALHLAMSLEGSGKILIVCPKSVIPGWRRSIEMFGGDHGKRFCIVNYESAKNLIKPPPKTGRNAKRAKTKRGESNRKKRINVERVTKGQSYVKWDVIVFDESHYLTNFESQRSKASEIFINANSESKVIRISATIGHDPTKLGYLARGFAWRTGRTIPRQGASLDQWFNWCERQGFDVEKVTWGPSTTIKWTKNDADLERINHLLFGGKISWAVRADPGWGSINRYQVPIELDQVEHDAYQETWDEFQKTMRTLEKLKSQGGTSNAKQQANQKGLAAQIRYRQKVGILKAPYIASYIKDLIDSNDVQVAVSCEFLGTVDVLIQHLGASKVAEFTGRNEATREEERVAFQTGKKPIIIFTPSEGFNLQQGELIDNDVPRIQICGEPSWLAIKGKQKEGRTNRNGMKAPVIYPSAVNTTDYKIIKGLMDGYDNISKMMGDESVTLNHVAQLLDISTETLGEAT